MSLPSPKIWRFLDDHPEVGSMNHLVEVALREFATIHRDDKTGLQTEKKIGKIE